MGMTVSFSECERDGVYYPSAYTGQSLDAARYNTAHDYKGGIRALADLMGVSHNTLTHKVNPNTATHHLTQEEGVRMMELTGNVAMLHAQAARLGFVVQPATPAAGDGSPLDVLAHWLACVADVSKATADGLSDGRRPSINDVRRVEDAALEVQSALGHVVGMMRARMRKPADGGAA